MSAAHAELDRLISIAGEHGWAVDDDRSRGVLWFTRGQARLHLGTNAAGEPHSLYYGERLRPARFWAAKRGLDGTAPDRLALLEQALTKREGNA